MTNDLTNINEELKHFFSEHAQEGTEDMGAGTLLPLLKVTGGLSDNKLMNGEQSKTGMLYHSGLKEEFKSVHASILYVKKCRLPDFNKTKQQLNYVIGGFLTEEQAPFVMFIKGLALRPFWDYQKEMNDCVIIQKVPLFAQKVIITSIKRDANVAGKTKHIDVPLITLEKTKNGMPMIETRLEVLRVLQLGIEKVKTSISAMIDIADGIEEVDEYVDQQNRTPKELSQQEKDMEQIFGEDSVSPEPSAPTQTEDISSDIPF